jgi:hypothetical protein
MIDSQALDVATPSVCANGIDVDTGQFLMPPLAVRDVARLVRGEPLERSLGQLASRRRRAGETAMGLGFGLDAQDLSQAGWGVVFAAGAAPGQMQALDPLLRHRRQQAGDRYQAFDGARALRPGERTLDWLARQGVGPGPAQVSKVPYYLLLVGDPEAIAYRVQFELSVNYAVGRICFDQVDDYRRYAESVVEAEGRASDGPRRAAFFGVRNQGDAATQMSADRLVAPVAQRLQQGVSTERWNIECRLGSQATKSTLDDYLNGRRRPDLLFTASHGLGFAPEDPRQARGQGALLCQDWPGPLAAPGRILPDWYFGADDVSPDAHVAGMVSFHFACYGAGTPREDLFAHRAGVRGRIAERAFVAALPQALLAHPNGGALAVVGHVERAWGYSFLWPNVRDHTAIFEDSLSALMHGSRIGVAMDGFAMKFSELSVGLNAELEDIRFGAEPDEENLAMLWTASNDAKSHVILGDPAVRL